jgi:hypothetical protein
MNALIADLVLIVHFAFVLFVTGGLALIYLGTAAGWRWVRNFWFRVIHFGAIVFVAGEALAGVWCPLTMWEAQLRGVRADKSFMAQWIHKLMFYDLPEWVFTTAYVVFALAVAATFWLAPPMRHRAR